MYRALYRYNSTDEQALSFGEGDQFTVMDTTDGHWWLVQNGLGQVGYVPANYITQNNAAFGDVVRSIDRAIEAIHSNAGAAGGLYTHTQRENLQKLLQHRKSVSSKQWKSETENLPSQPCRKAPTPPLGDVHDVGKHKSAAPKVPHLNTQSTTNSSLSKRSSLKTKAAPLPPDTSTNVSTGQRQQEDHDKETVINSQRIQNNSSSPPQESSLVCASKSSPSVDTTVPENIGSELMERVRIDTGLSHNKCSITIAMILGHIGKRIPEISAVMDDIVKQVVEPVKEQDSLEGCHDAVRLEVIFSEMESCKEDSQQRSWALHEDEAIILAHLEELLSILNNADPAVCNQIVSRNHYEALDTLVVYYQMETRMSIRQTLLKVFGALCGLDAHNITHLLSTVLPLELSRDILTETKEVQKLLYSALVLTMVFSMGESPAIHHYSQLNEAFVGYLLDSIDHPLPDDADEQLPDMYVNLLLAFNLHFEIPKENLVMKELARRGTAKSFTEKVMLLVNRGDDPVMMFAHEPRPPNAVLKLLMDIYSSPSTSQLLYTNDAKVLIDIIVRQLTDLSPGDKLRTEYISLVHLILRNTDYSEHLYRCAELQLCFTSFKQEEERDSEMDRLIVKQIWKEFPRFFSET